ncbi:hypothetical protein GM658_12595 [Pseudoduganella eburnea]|uniref:DUF1983 domain-containing protein n=1 Tax=Massilia eburnea TaxID=1776165 RepID=A0A6L6QIG6_9BURK|nr:hypothetical protein [Massilia eburnea]MTW11436.1 hypothetical protein [Massilia eburnea]
MAAFVNDRTVLIMAANPRYAPPTDRGMFLTPASAVFKVASDGQSASPGSCTFKATLLNMSGAVAWSCSAGITLTTNGNEVTVTYANFAAVSGTVTATLTVDGVQFTQTATLSKVADGVNGTNGAPGAPGTPGAAGARGNVDIAAITTGNVWSDTEAAAALSAAGYGAPKSRDMVTLYKADRTFSVQKMYSGSAWVTVDYVYNGNIFVKGSILPEAIDTRNLTVKDAAGNVIFGAGTNLDKSRVNANFGSNLLYNGDFSLVMDGWTGPSGNGPTVAASGINLGGWWPSYSQGKPGANVMWSCQGNTVTNSSVSDGSYYYEYIGYQIPIEAGKTYVVSAYTGAHRCVVNVFLYFYNSADQVIGVTSGAGAMSGVWTNAAEAGGGTNLSSYKRLYGYNVAPAGTVYCRVILRKYATIAGNSDSYMFVGRVMLEEVPAGVTTPGIWSVGQAVAPITMGNVSSYIQGAVIGLAQINTASIGSLSALSATIGTLRTANWGGRMEIESNQQRIYDDSNNLVVQIGRLDP